MNGDDRRNQGRVALDPPGLAVLRTGGDNGGRATAFVDVLNVSPTGLMVQAGQQVPDPDECLLQYFDHQAGDWRVAPCRRVWETETDEGRGRLWGMALETGNISGQGLALPPSDIDFLMRMGLLASVPRRAVCRLLNCLTRQTFADGEPLVRQGEPGDSLYVIQSGQCLVEVAKNGTGHDLAVLRPGDVVGEMAVLTGEPRTATALAQGEVTAWRLTRSDFERLSGEQPHLRSFLTELVANRFESSPVTAERTVAKYVIRGKLGQGEWSIVYNGVHQALNMPVAVKMMRHDMAMNPAFLRTFRQEANTIAQLRHPNIVQVFDIEELYRTVFIVMESLTGYSLREIMSRAGRLPAHRAANILAQICAGLDYAHSQGVVHRDVKPANVFVQEDDRIKILDFGLACTPEDEGLGIPGTPLYVSPEQVAGRPATPLADMYSVGLMAYEMVTGERPFPEEGRTELLRRRRNAEIPDPRLLVPDLPGPLAEFIMICTRRDPAERYESLARARGVLAPLLSDEGLCARRKMTSLFLFYPEEAQSGVNELMEEISARAEALGLELRAAEVKDV